jgi:hypothetical protein
MHRFGGIEGSQLELGENKKNKNEIEYWWAGLHVRPYILQCNAMR